MLIPEKFRVFYCDDKIDADMCVAFMRDENPLWKEFMEWRKNMVKMSCCKMITINPKEGTDINNFVNKVEKAMKKKWILESEWCFEWREGEKGLHCHAVVSHNKKRPSEIKREFVNTFKGLIGNNLHVNIKNVPNGYEKIKALGYLKGMKKGKAKSNYEKDVLNRKKYNLKSIYKYAKTD